jgi:hypothetical protein
MTAGEGLRVLEAEGDDLRRWHSLLDDWPAREVFAHPEYLRLFTCPGERPTCFVFSSSSGVLVHPTILRDLRALAFWTDEAAWDVLAPPFGYGGPFVIAADDRVQLFRAFFTSFREWAADTHVASEYHAFNPKDDQEVPYPGQVLARAPTVLRATDLSKDAIWLDYKGSVRTDIRNARQLDLAIEDDLEGQRVAEFLSVYESTMDRNEAASQYRLTLEFLQRLNEQLKGYYAYFHCLERDHVISTELVLVSGDSTFFFRGGTLGERLRTRANHLLKHRIIEWSHEQGKRFYLLGGGNSAEDSLFKYKRSFAPHGVRKHRAGTWVLEPELYQRLVSARRSHEAGEGRSWSARPGFFPEYRAPAAEGS